MLIYMSRVKFYFYEILTVSFGLALIAFFGTLSFFPMEIMLLGEELSWLWVYILLIFSVFIVFILLSFYKKKYSLVIVRVVDTLTIICAIIAIVSFLIYTQDVIENWFVQGAWFLRDNGLIIGILLSLIMIKSVASLSFLITKFNEIGGKSPGEKDKEVLSFVIIVLSFGFYIIEFFLYRYFTFYSCLFSIFIFQACLSIMSVFLISNSSYKELLVLKIPEKTNDLTINSRFRKSFSKINLKLTKSGMDRTSFWWLLYPLLVIIIINIVTLATLMSNLFVSVNIGRPILMPLAQILSISLIAMILFVLTFNVFGGRIRKRFGDYYKEQKRSRSRRGNINALDGQKFLGVFLTISQVLYFFEYPLYFPQVVSFNLLFGIVGAIIYHFLGKTDKQKNVLYSIAIILLIINLILCYFDGMANNTSVVVDGSIDLAPLPYLYLHSWSYFMMAGIPVGIIMSDLLLNVGFKHTDGTDSINRGLLFAFALFIGGMISMPLNFLLNNPGGSHALLGTSTLYFILMIVIYSVFLLLGLIYHIHIEFVLPKIHEKKMISKRNYIIKTKKTTVVKQKIKRKFEFKREDLQKKTIAISFSIIFIVTLIGGIFIFVNYKQNHEKPILAHSPGNYYVWLQKSSERVTKDFVVAVDTSPSIDAVEISLAKNEYGAFQLVWRPLRQFINSLTYSISNFTCVGSPSNMISASDCRLRYEDYIIEETIPDILVPFTSINLNKLENYVLWFSMKTPYDILEGEYRGNIIFNINGADSEIIEINLTVWNFTIPEMRHLRTSIGSFSQENEKIQNYLYHRMNDYGVRISEASTYAQLQAEEEYTCYYNATANDWVFNWTWWDNLTEYKLNNTMNAFGIRDPIDWDNHRNPDLTNATAILKLERYLQQVQAHIQNKSWLNYSYFYFIDEFNLNIPSGYTRQQYFTHLENYLIILNDSAPLIKITATVPPRDEYDNLDPYFDIYCPVSETYDKTKWDSLMAQGKEFWYYPCVGPFAPWPNSHVYNHLYECRVLMWQTWLYGIHGYLYWQSQAYSHASYGFGANGYGDGWFLYERDGKLYDSLRWENYLDGQEDYEYLWLLNATLRYLTNNPGLISEIKLANLKAEFQGIVNNIVGERYIYCDHPSTLYNGRDRVGVILDDLSSVVNTTIIGEAQWLPPY